MGSNLHDPAKFSGTVTSRTLLSALPVARRVEVGLNRIQVGGKSCAFSIVNSGCKKERKKTLYEHNDRRKS
jgi:adenine/guanine phosphoribosyltransferase-like PRPP-binding protein